MSDNKKKVVVAMSGGVDSSVSAAVLVEQGYEVSGLMMRLWSESGSFSATRDNRCCTRDQMIDAHFVAKRLGIPFEVVDARDVFKKNVVDRFIEGYSQGATPNPCLSCNRHIRFDFLLNEALARGADYLATGHYARITQSDDGLFQLRTGEDERKDQSYVLSVMTQQQLAHTLFPVGELTKPEVREIARDLGLRVAEKSESMDLCFVADGDYKRFLIDHAPQAFEIGPIILKDGERVGEHRGLPAYTIGQRKGLGIAYSEPLYVIEKRVSDNTLVVGTRAQLGQTRLIANTMNWVDGSPPLKPIQVDVKIRYKSRGVPAVVTAEGQQHANVQFEEPLPGIAPGQGAVFYEGNRVVGSGVISKFVAEKTGNALASVS